MVRNLNVAIIEKRKEALEKRRAEYWQDELQKKKEEFERDGFRALTLDDNGPVPVHTLSNSAVVRKDLGQHILAAKQFARECVGEGDVLNLKKILAYYKLNGDVNTRFLLSALPYRVLNQVKKLAELAPLLTRDVENTSLIYALNRRRKHWLLEETVEVDGKEVKKSMIRKEKEEEEEEEEKEEEGVAEG
mmetsp:Transcript_12570/g.16856  ORF Transcript_12570/g.16856 Transcript_12570/m.16856 type:complete len:190 (+) Transcript_12570:116-685(+)